jgi:hypothetical protein
MDGVAYTGEARTHIKPADTKLFQDISALHIIEKDQIQSCRAKSRNGRCQASGVGEK